MGAVTKILRQIVQVEQAIYDFRMADALENPDAWNDIEKLEWERQLLDAKLALEQHRAGGK